jgi:hypothetical protein
MSATRTVEQLWGAWRQGDARAGQSMAQRISDWYFALATARVGENAGREARKVASARFAEGVAAITDGRELIPWAHRTLLAELGSQRATDGDEASAFTAKRPPKALLAEARAGVPAAFSLIERMYRGERNLDPHACLLGRYQIKRWLRDTAGVPFRVVPDAPDPDRAPMPLWEAARLAGPQEDHTFEQWLSQDIDLCQDVAEFAHFAIALRGGIPEVASAIRTPPAAQPAVAPPPPPEAIAFAPPTPPAPAAQTKVQGRGARPAPPASAPPLPLPLWVWAGGLAGIAAVAALGWWLT